MYLGRLVYSLVTGTPITVMTVTYDVCTCHDLLLQANELGGQLGTAHILQERLDCCMIITPEISGPVMIV